MTGTFLTQLRQKNNERQKLWTGAQNVDVLFRAVEFAGEAGEVANAVKKVYRSQNGIIGNNKDINDLMENLVEEIGDVLITIDLLANEYGIDLEHAVKTKFNKTSNKVNIPVFME
jgi:NTP pyrophosphatase (non-canonical NTP hydrolase)